MNLYTIRFTQKSAEEFFSAIRTAKIRRLIDVRLRNASQLAGFAKRGDLEFFLRELADVDYVHEPLLAPRVQDLDAYRAKKMSWDVYAVAYIETLRERRVETTLPRALFEVTPVLLCSEATPQRCHRRLAGDYLAEAWGDLRLIHL